VDKGNKNRDINIEPIRDSLEILFEKALENLVLLKQSGVYKVEGEIELDDLGAARLGFSLGELAAEKLEGEFHDPFCAAGLFNILDIDDLDLAENAEAAAKILRDAHPGKIIFTSGRRDVSKQASAMAQNVVTNRKWIEQTYTNTTERAELQEWVDDNPDADTKSEIASGLASIMSGWSDVRLRKISRHLSGDAFDVAPVSGNEGDRIKTTMRSLPELHKVLFREGGIEIWHAQFNPS
tara:strand:- start:12222 stop:12935 length:714 start_codon:yes stop_codon:yes gene_type:complete